MKANRQKVAGKLKSAAELQNEAAALFYFNTVKGVQTSEAQTNASTTAPSVCAECETSSASDASSATEAPQPSNNLGATTDLSTSVVQSWLVIEEPVNSCLQIQYKMDPNALRNAGVSTSDPRVAPYIANCRQAILQKLYQDWAARGPALIAKYGEKTAKNIFNGKVQLGMGYDEVLLAWGEPNKRQPIGQNSEKWLYDERAVTFTRKKAVAVDLH